MDFSIGQLTTVLRCAMLFQGKRSSVLPVRELLLLFQNNAAILCFQTLPRLFISFSFRSKNSVFVIDWQGMGPPSAGVHIALDESKQLLNTPNFF